MTCASILDWQKAIVIISQFITLFFLWVKKGSLMHPSSLNWDRDPVLSDSLVSLIHFLLISFFIFSPLYWSRIKISLKLNYLLSKIFKSNQVLWLCISESIIAFIFAWCFTNFFLIKTSKKFLKLAFKPLGIERESRTGDLIFPLASVPSRSLCWCSWATRRK